jgi:aminoglycoside 6'-N-acetyltransferase I
VPEVLIRRLELADRGAWAGLRHALWPEHTIDDLRDELAGMVEEGLVGFGAFEGATLVGFAEAGERAYGDGCHTAPVAWLEGIYVLPGARRRGLGRRLVSAVEAWARAAGYRELGSDARLDNLISRLGHARWGFEETERVVMFRKVLA